MSHLWPELLRITLCPDQIVLERGKLVISLKGVEHRYSTPEIISVDATHEPALWAAPLAVLKIALDGLPDRRRDISVILSNHFVHYPLVDSAATQADDFSLGFVEPQLQAAISRLLEPRNCRLISIEPRAVALATNYPDGLQGEPGWLVLIEEGLACLCLIRDGEFVRFRNLYMWPASSVELLEILNREARKAGFQTPPRTLLLWIRDEMDEIHIPKDSGWEIVRIKKKPAEKAATRRFGNGRVTIRSKAIA